jgi:hypothetical protein
MIAMRERQPQQTCQITHAGGLSRGERSTKKKDSCGADEDRGSDGQPASGSFLDRRAGRTHSVENGSPARLRLELS